MAGGVVRHQYIRTKVGILKGRWTDDEASHLAKSVRGKSVADELRDDIKVWGHLDMGFDAVRDKVAREQFPDHAGITWCIPWQKFSTMDVA